MRPLNTEINLQSFAWALFLAIGVIGYLLRAVGYFTCVPGELGDARYNSVILEHLFRWVVHQDPSLWSPAFFYPFEHTLAFSDNHFGSAITYVIFRLAGLKREIAYDAWFFVGVCLNYLVAFYVFRRLGFSSLAASVGAFVFAFALPNLAHEDGRSQMVHRFPIPLAMLAVFRAIRNGRLFDSWPAFFWMALQVYCSIYLGVFLGYLLVAMVAGFLLLKEGRHGLAQAVSSFARESTSNKFIFISAAALSALAVGWLLHRYQIVSREYGLHRQLYEIANWLPRPGSYLLAERSGLSSWLGDHVEDLPVRGDHQMFPGIGVSLIAAIGALAAWNAKQHDLIGRVSCLALALLFAATLYVGGHSIYYLLLKIPGISAIRMVSRIILVMLFPLAILAAIGAERIVVASRFQSRSGQALLVVGLALLLGAETAYYDTYNTQISEWRGRIAALKKLLPAHLPDRPVLYVSMIQDEYNMPFFAELDGMVLAQDMGIPTINGYSGNTLPGYFKAVPCLSFASRINSYADFRGQTRESLADLARRVVHLAPEPCRGKILFTTDQVFSPEQARSMLIKVGNVDHANVNFPVLIENHSPAEFNPASTKGQVKLSWRFVPVNAAGVALSDPGWGTRQDLWVPIAANGSVSEMVHFDFPPPQGQYRLEVSLVQEGVSWFHDIGMPIGILMTRF